MLNRGRCTVALAALAFVAPRSAVAQCASATTHGPVDECLHSYTGDAEFPNDPTKGIPHNCRQQYRVFLPSVGTKPPGGWPVVIHCTLANFATSAVDHVVLPNSLDDKLLNNGMAVIIASLTISTENLACETDAPLSCPEPVSQNILGDGTFHPPDYVPLDLVGAGTMPYNSTAYAMPEKDGVMLVQHVRFAAANHLHPLEQIDGTKVAVLGGSASAMSLMWTTLGPERNNHEPFLSLGGQFDMSSRPDVAVLTIGAVWYPIFNPELASVPGLFELHFGAGGHSETAATKMRYCDKAELQQASAIYYEPTFDGSIDPDPSMRLLMVYAQRSYCTSHVNQGPAGPYLYSFLNGGLEGFDVGWPVTCGDTEAGTVHPSWSGFEWKVKHQASTRLIIGWQETATCEGEGIEEEVLPDSDCEIAAWLHDRFDEMPNPWSLFEHALVDGTKTMIGTPGVDGVPQLTGVGKLEPGGGNQIKLTHVPPGSTAWLVYGQTTAVTPAYGGVSLVSGQPTPFPTGTGSLTLPANAIASQHGTTWWFQFLVEDPSVPSGITVSNALRAIVP